MPLVTLDLQSERYAATGNISGAGIRRSLGTPTLDSLQIVIREAVQNAWDARFNDATTVTFAVRLRTLTQAQRTSLIGLLTNRPLAGNIRDALQASLSKRELLALEISDHGTTGLGGPVRADVEPRDNDRPDFVNFFRNIGSTRDRELGGGTYGYGKSALFRLSRCGTLFGYTRTVEGGRATTRLMGCSLGSEFEHRRVRYTGRHWWGKNREGVVDPVTATSADNAADAMGLEKRAPDDFGTTLMVLDPDFDERTAQQAARAITECLVWFFWPKMIEHPTNGPAMRFEVWLDSERLAIPSIDQFHPLPLFREAMAQVKTGSATEVRCERPIRLLGSLGIAKGPRHSRVLLDTGSDKSLVPDRCACIALMRPAELVVKYLSVTPIASDMIEYAGVFICDPSVETSFADAEPPAHDDWIPDFLERPGKTFVNVALKRLDSLAAQFANPVAAPVLPAEQKSLALIADELGDVLIGQLGNRVRGNGADDVNNPRSNDGQRVVRDLVLSEPVPFRFAIVRRTPCAVFRLHISSSRARVQLMARALVVLEGGATERADETSGPRVIAWMSATGEHLAADAEITVNGKFDDYLLIAVSIAHDAAVAVEVTSFKAN